MSKSTLEKILKQLQADVYETILEFTKGKREVVNDNDWIPQRQKATQAIKQHYLGLIGEDEESNISYPPKGFSNIRFDLSKPRNQLRQELRQSIESEE